MDLFKPDKKIESIARQLVATNLLALRQCKGMSQAQFAKQIAVSQRALRRYERGERELPFATRLTVIKKFNIDLLASDQFASELGLEVAELELAATNNRTEDVHFWQALRLQRLALREQHYSPVGRLLLKVRDQAYLSATMYFAMAKISMAAGVPFGFKINGIDWILIGSFVVIILLISSVVAELPALKAAHYIFRNTKARLTK